MLKVTVLCVGTLKEAYLRDLCMEYEKRLQRYCNLQIVQLEEVKIQREESSAETQKALTREKEMLLEKLPKGDFVVSLCVEGKQLSSEELAATLDRVSLEHSGITFIIGSSHGLSEEVKKRSHLKLSFSKMTFPHQLMRGILLEQVYRGFQINSGGKYHK